MERIVIAVPEAGTSKEGPVWRPRQVEFGSMRSMRPRRLTEEENDIQTRHCHTHPSISGAIETALIPISLGNACRPEPVGEFRNSLAPLPATFPFYCLRV